MDPRVMELRIKKWIPVIEEQAKSGMTKNEWCACMELNGSLSFGGRNGSGRTFLNNVRPIHQSIHHLFHLIMK